MTSHLKKLEHHCHKMIFVGYESVSKAYRAYDLIMKRVHVTRDWGTGGDNDEPDGGEDVFTVEYTTKGPKKAIRGGSECEPIKIP
jgi:hypothetical protein